MLVLLVLCSYDASTHTHLHLTTKLVSQPSLLWCFAQTTHLSVVQYQFLAQIRKIQTKKKILLWVALAASYTVFCKLFVSFLISKLSFILN